jgi:hypothetical protein
MGKVLMIRRGAPGAVQIRMVRVEPGAVYAIADDETVLGVEDTERGEDRLVKVLDALDRLADAAELIAARMQP